MKKGDEITITETIEGGFGGAMSIIAERYDTGTIVEIKDTYYVIKLDKDFTNVFIDKEYVKLFLGGR